MIWFSLGILYLTISLLPWVVAQFRRHERRLAILGLTVVLLVVQLLTGLAGLDEIMSGTAGLVGLQQSFQAQAVNVISFVAYLGLLGWAAIGRRSGSDASVVADIIALFLCGFSIALVLYIAYIGLAS